MHSHTYFNAIIIIIIIFFFRLRQQGGGYVIILSFCHSFCHSANKITDERGNGRRPNLAGMGKR